MGKEYTIWTSDPDYEEYRHDPEEDLQDFTEEERIAVFRQANYDSLEVQKNEMTVKFGMPILIVAQLGLWDGQHMAYKQIDSGNLADCFEGSRYTLNIRWYVDDRGDLRCDDCHHDGVNHYLYRVIRSGTPKRQMSNTGIRMTVKTRKLSAGMNIGRLLRMAEILMISGFQPDTQPYSMRKMSKGSPKCRSRKSTRSMPMRS